MSRRQERGSDYHLPRRGARHRFLIVTGIALLSVLGASGILLAIAGLRDWRRSSASADWPMTEAEITSSKLVKRFIPSGRVSNGGVRYVREISFRYTVNAREYTSDSTLPVPAALPANADSLREPNLSMGSGERLTVRYDPLDPQTVVVYPGADATPFSTILVGIMLAVACPPLVFILRSWLAKAGS